MFMRHTIEAFGPRLAGVLTDDDFVSPSIQFTAFTYKKGQEIYGEGEPADYVYHIVEGAVRSYKLLPDGRRQIGAFHLAGDIFGLENDRLHRFTTEAIVRTKVKLIRRHSLETWAEADAGFALNLLNLTTDNLRHAENHMLLLGRKTAMERVSAFLLEMDERLAASDLLALPMTRRDIADYLGLSLETVSRALSRLEAAGVLGFPERSQKQIVLLDRERLREHDRPN